MKDKTGVYYFPFPQNKRVRMYVKQASATVFFRLWSADDPTLWEEHGWVPYDAIEQAAAMYSGKGFDPKTAYDVHIARAVLRDEGDGTKPM